MENVRAKVLRKGDTIGVISPSSPTFRPSSLWRGVETLEKWGFHVVLADHVNRKNGFFAGTDQERAQDLNEMFRRDDIDGVFVVRGGYGASRLLKDIDFEMIRQHPKAFLGFSDITALHLAIRKKAGLVTFHGPGVANIYDESLTEYTHRYLEKALFSSEPVGEIEMADPKKYLHRIHGGTAEGELIGGNISMICSTLGTPYEIETEGKILFMEDLDTEPWVMDHMMTHLRNAGKFDGVAGVVIGECYNCEPRALEPTYYVDRSLEEIFEEFLQPLGVPVLYGYPLGHTSDIATLPLGVRVRVDGDNKRFTVLESGFAN